jgi:thiamine-monophosphate kinase
VFLAANEPLIMTEFELIQRYFAQAAAAQPHGADVSLGIGDDCALITPPMGQQLAISTDTLVSGRHFPVDTDAFSIGWKAVAVNLSDLAAMGATPHSVLLALTLPDADAAFLAELSRGIFAQCQQHGVRLIGGDTTRGPCLSLTLTVLGWLPTGSAVCRHGAQVDDLIVVTGTLGDAAYALRHPHSPLQHRLDRPEPRSTLGPRLRGVASAMLDVSDGLAQDLGHILRASALGAALIAEQLPLHPIVAALPLAERLSLALTGGDDYELCLTVAPHRLAELHAVADASQTPITVIGQMTAQRGLSVLHHGQPVDMTLTGFLHFDR